VWSVIESTHKHLNQSAAADGKKPAVRVVRALVPKLNSSNNNSSNDNDDNLKPDKMIINGENVGNNNDQNNDHKSNNDDASTTSASPGKRTGHSESDTPRSKMLKSERGVSQPTEEKMSLVGINIPSTRIAEVSSGEGEGRRERELEGMLT